MQQKAWPLQVETTYHSAREEAAAANERAAVTAAAVVEARDLALVVGSKSSTMV